MINKLDENVELVQTLADKPSISSNDLKKVFDRGNKIIKEYINYTLVPEINGSRVEVINNLNTSSTTKALSAEQGRQLNINKQDVIGYGKEVPTLAEGQIFIQIFD